MLKQNRKLSPDEIKLTQILNDVEKKNAELKKGLEELEKRGTLDPVLKPNGGPTPRNMRIMNQSKEDIFQALDAINTEAKKEVAIILLRMDAEKQQHYSLRFTEVFNAAAIHPDYAAQKETEKNNVQKNRDIHDSKFVTKEFLNKDIDRDER